MIIDDVTGNITHISDSVILDIGTSSDPSSNESHSDNDLAEVGEIDEGTSFIFLLLKMNSIKSRFFFHSCRRRGR